VDNKFGAKLRAAREHAWMSVSELAEHLKISASYLSRIETGSSSAPNAATVRKAAKRLGLNPGALEHLAASCRTGMQCPGEFGGYIRRARSTRRISRAALANGIGIPTDKLRKIEEGQLIPILRLIPAISDVLRVPVRELQKFANADKGTPPGSKSVIDACHLEGIYVRLVIDTHEDKIPVVDDKVHLPARLFNSRCRDRIIDACRRAMSHPGTTFEG
jgi:transcriptional regulator with XRE-family HTH domain